MRTRWALALLFIVLVLTVPSVDAQKKKKKGRKGTHPQNCFIRPDYLNAFCNGQIQADTLMAKVFKTTKHFRNCFPKVNKYCTCTNGATNTCKGNAATAAAELGLTGTAGA